MKRGHDIRIKLKLILILAMIGFADVVLSTYVNPLVVAHHSVPSPTAPTDTLEGCLNCHDKIEPMHRFGPTATLDKLDHGKDALGLTCTACHGGNPIATEKDSAHVRPKFPREWQQNGKFKIPERSGPLLAREGPEFVRFVNPGDLRVAQKTCGSSECHSTET